MENLDGKNLLGVSITSQWRIHYSKWKYNNTRIHLILVLLPMIGLPNVITCLLYSFTFANFFSARISDLWQIPQQQLDCYSRCNNFHLKPLMQTHQYLIYLLCS